MNCWNCIVEYSYIGKIESSASYETILMFHTDRRLRRKASVEEKQKVISNCKLFYYSTYSMLFELVDIYGIQGMIEYLNKIYLATHRLLRIKTKPNLLNINTTNTTNTTNTVNRVQENNSDAGNTTNDASGGGGINFSTFEKMCFQF